MTFVWDQCVKAYERVGEYSMVGTPTAWFDGGYEFSMGGAPNHKEVYRPLLEASETRPVEDVDLDIDVYWRADATMHITVSVQNNDTSAYDGWLRIYVTEIQSSLGWKDAAGVEYDYPMLEYAFNQEISIPGMSTWEDEVFWDGKLYDSGYGQSYEDIQWDNIKIVGAVFNDEWHQGYYTPPTGDPFDIYYVDDADAAAPENTLRANVYTVPEKGGSVDFYLNAGSAHKFREYVVLGALSGTDPGRLLPGGHATIPLNLDTFTWSVVYPLLNSTVFWNFKGKLNAYGDAAAQLNVPTLPPGYVGLVMYYAYCLMTPYDFASNPIEIQVI